MTSNPTRTEISLLTGSVTPGTGGARLSQVDLWVYSGLIVPADGATIYVGDSVAQNAAGGLALPAIHGGAYNLKNIWVRGAGSGDVANWVGAVVNP